MVAKVVIKMGETVREQGVLYKAVVQTLLMYGRNIWVSTEILKVIEVFHNWSARRIVGITAHHKTGGEW